MNIEPKSFGMFVILTYMYVYGVVCHSMDDAKKLFADKMIGYEKNFRPVVNQSEPIYIYIAFELVAIQDFNEVKEQLTVSSLIRAHWFDEYMAWNITEYGGLQNLVIESDNVWTPSLVLVNNVQKLEKIDDAWQIIRFSPNGFAYYFPANVLSVSCRVDVTYYPWDMHKCKFRFSTLAQFKTEVIFEPLVNEILTSYYTENGAWEFYNSSVEFIHGSNSINFCVYLRRKPQFALVNVVLPIIFMAFLNTVIYAIPVESGERISYSITVLLALAVFLTLVGDNFPKTSSPMSLFGYYLLVILIISIAITLTTIFNVRLYYNNEEQPIPEWIVCFVRRLQCRCRNKPWKCTDMKTGDRPENKTMDHGHCSPDENDEDSFLKKVETNTELYYKLSRKKIYRQASQSKDPRQCIPRISCVDDGITVKEKRPEYVVNDSTVSWKDVSLALDKVFFAISFLTIVITTTMFFAYIFSSKNN